MIDKGHIVERGTHDTLLAKEGVYKKLVLRQLSTSRHAAAAAAGDDDDEFDPALLAPGEPPIKEDDES